MPNIIIQADIAGGDAPLATLRERIIGGNLDSDHYAAQLIERITWAVADAEAAESGIETAESIEASRRRAATTTPLMLTDRSGPRR